MKPGEYIKEVKNEMTHVIFPDKKKTAFFTVLVIVFAIGVSIALGLFDFLFKEGLSKLLNF